MEKRPVMLFFLLQCASTGKSLSYLGLGSVSELTVAHLERLCSGVLTQLLLPSCLYAVPAAQPPLHNSGELLHRAAGLFVRPRQRKYSNLQFNQVRGCLYSCVRSAKSKISNIFHTSLSEQLWAPPPHWVTPLHEINVRKYIYLFKAAQSRMRYCTRLLQRYCAMRLGCW